jgi:hypothetical protein
MHICWQVIAQMQRGPRQAGPHFGQNRQYRLSGIELHPAALAIQTHPQPAARPLAPPHFPPMSDPAALDELRPLVVPGDGRVRFTVRILHVLRFAARIRMRCRCWVPRSAATAAP